MASPRIHEPTDLGRLSAVDPLVLEPGMIVWDRFCVVGKVRHATPLWSVPVTDLAREFGRAPHHRVVLEYLPVIERQRERVRRAVAADEQVQPRVRATVDLSEGMVLIHEPVEGEHLGAQLPAREARVLALALSGLLVRLHEAKVRGVALRVADLRQSEGQFRLKGFDHLYGGGAGEQDVDALLMLLRRVAAPHLAELLDPPPRSSTELWGRARALSQTIDITAVTPLSQNPPFVGREKPRRTLEQAFADAQIARSSVTLVVGGQGVGKSRMLEEFASWLRVEDRALVLHGEYLRGCGESRGGLMGALGRLPVALAKCPVEVAERVRERLARRTGSLAGVLASYAPALAELLGEPPQPPALEFEEGFARHAVAIADGIRSIGSQERPLVLLLDNLQLADRGSVAVLRRLLLEDRNHHTMIVAGLCGQIPPGLVDAPEESHWNPQRDPQLLLRRIVLEPLGVAELERLIVAGLPGPVARPHELAEVLHTSSRGNPLVAWATLQSWIEGGVLVRGESDPWALRRRKVAATSPDQVFAERVDHASLDERWLGLLAAIAGGHVDEAWFQRVSSWDPRRVASAVAGLERRGLMGKAGEASLRFPHELVRELLIERSSAGDIRRAHAAVANWLASLGPRVSAARLAYHTDRALGQESKNDPRLVEMHLAAGREMLGVYDLERSNWHFTRALIERGDPSGRLAAIEGAADVALLGDKVEEAAQLYAEAVVQAESPLIAGRIAAKAVHGLFRKAAAGEAATIGRLALARADRPLPSGGMQANFARLGARLALVHQAKPSRHDEPLREQLCWLYARLAQVLTLPDPEGAELCLLRARRLARGLESPAAANVLALHAAQLAMQGDIVGGKIMMRQATDLSERVRSDWAQGMVRHLRGMQIELPVGDYNQGLQSLDEAVSHFRRTGDLSVALSSLFFKVVYGRDREPLPTLHGWLDEAAALTEAQGDSVVDLAIESLRLYLRARAGARGVVESAASLSARACARQLVSFEGYLPHAYLALALLEVGEPARAREQIELALARTSERSPMPEFAFDLWVALALVLVRTRVSRADRRQLARALSKLDRAGRVSPRLAALAQLVRLRQAMASGARDKARQLAAALIASQSEHGQLHLTLEAHRTLGELMRGGEVLAAREHLRLAQELAERLGIEQARDRERERENQADDPESSRGDTPRPRKREASSRRHSNAYLRALARNELVDASAVLEGSRAVLLETLGNVPWLYLRAQPELRLYGELIELQSLLVHLALCARDSVDEPQQLRAVGTLEELDERRASEIPGGSPGTWGRIAVTVVGGNPINAGVTGGVSACRQVATRLGGFLQVTHEDGALTLSVYLPPERRRSRTKPVPQPADGEVAQVLVLHPEPLIRETLSGAISRLGHSCEAVDPAGMDLTQLPPVKVIFADGETLQTSGQLLKRVPMVVAISSRGAVAVSGFPLLRVPFALGELRRILEGASGSPTP